ncbi:TlpA family protein disulfide reductase [Thermodesulfobacteriota bacterium]
MKKSLIIAIFIVLTLVTASYSSQDNLPVIGEGDIIPEFELNYGNSLDSSKILSFEKDIKGKSKGIVLLFVGSGCTASEEEIVLLHKLAEKYDIDIKIYAIEVDFQCIQTPDYSTFNSIGSRVTHLKDPYRTVPAKFGFTATPSLVIADGDGKIIFMKTGYRTTDDEELMAVVQDTQE